MEKCNYNSNNDDEKIQFSLYASPRKKENEQFLKVFSKINGTY